MTEAPQFLDRTDPLQHAPAPLPDQDGAVRYGLPYCLELPETLDVPVIFASPHSGSLYPDEMQSALCVPLQTLRRTEDAFVDKLFADVPGKGAMLLAARYARSVADLNRDPRELDPDMFETYVEFSSVPWRTGVLEPKVKELMYCAFDAAATHLYVPGLKLHMRNALRYGATKEEIMEMLEIVSVIGIHGAQLAAPLLEQALDAARNPPR